MISMIGIYAIRNKVDNKRYVGSSNDLHKRHLNHWRNLKMGTHFNSLLQRSWSKHGETNFEFVVLEQCSLDCLLEREKWWIEHYQSFRRGGGFNFSRTPRQTRLGCKASPETLQRMSHSMRGEKHPNWGRKLPSEWVNNMRKAITGIPKPNSGKRKKYRCKNAQGEIIEIDGLRRFCREHQLNLTAMFKVLHGQQKEHRGFQMVSVT